MQTRKPYVVRKAMQWLRLQYDKGLINKIGSDKNYGPALVSAGKISAQLDVEISGNAFREVSVAQFTMATVDAFDALSGLLASGVRRGYIDDSTRAFMLQGFAKLGLNPVAPVNMEAFKDVALGALGKLRYLIKLHKAGNALRRIEVDLKNPCRFCADYVASILGSVARKLDSVIMDSKEILVQLHEDRFPTHDLWFLSADLVNFFPSISISSLVASLRQCLREEYADNGNLGDFVCKLAAFILDHKFVCIRNRVYKKVSSLSIGERIGTDAANIHRHFAFRAVWEKYGSSILKKWGYVDDMGFVFHGSLSRLSDMVADMQAVDPSQFRWETAISPSVLNLLDLTIYKTEDFVLHGQLHTRTYRKPSFRPMYLPLTSQHPVHSKASIPSGEFTRMLINNSRAETYVEDLKMCEGYFEARGYSVVEAPCDFDACRREHFLRRFKHRDTGGRHICDVNLVTLVLPYFPGLRKVRLTNRLLSLSRSFPGIRLKAVYTNCPNSFLKTYPLNFERG